MFSVIGDIDTLAFVTEGIVQSMMQQRKKDKSLLFFDLVVFINKFLSQFGWCSVDLFAEFYITLDGSLKSFIFFYFVDFE
jgi:hypothetical protein